MTDSGIMLRRDIIIVIIIIMYYYSPTAAECSWPLSLGYRPWTGTGAGRSNYKLLTSIKTVIPRLLNTTGPQAKGGGPVEDFLVVLAVINHFSKNFRLVSYNL